MKKKSILAKRNLVDEATNWMREQVFSGKFSEGEILPSEGELAVQLGLSRNAMREAMRILATQGLIEISQGKRPKIKTIDTSAAISTLDVLLRRSGASLKDLIAVRFPIECEIAAIVATKANDENIKMLDQTIVNLKSANTIKERIAADMAFHKGLAQITGNPIFIIIYDIISGLLQDAQSITFPKAGVEIAIRGHSEILNSIKNGDSNTARKAMLLHLEESKRDLN
jgi:DNA-binding FadR family transcriptional regulator